MDILLVLYQGDFSKVLAVLAGAAMAIGLFVSVAVAPASAQGDERLLSRGFGNGTGGFSYADVNDPSGTNYVRGARGPGESNGGLQITLGGVNDDNVTNMEGRWTRDITMPRAGVATISFRYRVTQTPDYESDEWSEARLLVDGVSRAPAGGFPRVTGNGDGGSDIVAGWATYSALVQLSAGSHSVSLVGFNNAKTSTDEATTVEFDKFLVTIAPVGAATPTAVPTATSTPTAVPTATAIPTPTAIPTATPTSTAVPTATPTSTAVPTATPMPTPTPSLPGCGVGGLVQEAEAGTIVGDMVVVSDGSVSGGAYVEAVGVPNDNAAPGGNYVEYCINVPSSGMYRLDGTVFAPNANDDSFWVEMDGQAATLWDVSRDLAWHVDAASERGGADPVTWSLASGGHTLRIYQRENGTAIDKFELVPLAAQCAGLVQEAEAGLLSGSMVVESGNGSSGGAYVRGIPGSNPPAPTDFVEFCVTVPTAANYRIDATVLAPNNADDSFFVSVDGGAVATWDVARSSSWTVDSVANRNGADPVVYNLSAGDHIVRVAQREDGTSIDKIELVDLTPQVPTCAGLVQEAEFGIRSGTMVLASGAGASGNSYVQAEPGSRGKTFPSASYVEFCFTVPAGAGGLYRLDADVLAPTSTDDSFYVTVNGGSEATWDIPTAAGWQTDSVSDRNGANPMQYALTPGDHIVRVYQREDHTAIDKLSLVLDIPPTPTATSTPVPTATPIPTPTPSGVFSLFQNTNYGGSSQTFPPGVYVGSAGNLSAVGNDQASSHQIDAGYLALVCTNGGATGSCRGFTNPKTNLGNFGLNDNISYVQVRQIGDPFTLNAGSDVDQIVNALPDGTEFILQPGIHSGHEIVPKLNQVFNCEAGAILDGNGVNGVAFSAARGNAHNVEIRGCEIRNYDQGQYVGAINGRDTGNFNIEGLNWLVENNKIHSNEGPGVNMSSGMIVRNNEIWNNSQIGVSGIGSSSRYLDGVKVLDNDIHDNNYGPIYSTGNQYHEGGIKVTWTRNFEISGNDVHHNKGFGIHMDLSSHDGVVDGNQIRNITDSRRWVAYMYIEEESYRVTASNNVITTPPSTADLDQGQTFMKGIVAGGSNNNTIENNTINGGYLSGSPYHALGVLPYGGRNNNNNVFRGNTVNLQFNAGFVGVDGSDASGSRFIDNTYTGGLGLEANGNSVGWNSWRNNYGYDTTGSYS